MGGPCDEAFSGDDLKALSDQGYNHVQNAADDAHKELFAEMQKATPESMEQWNKDMQAKLDGMSEDA